MKQLLLIFLSLIYLAGISSAQYNLPQNKVWFLGNDLGLDFNTNAAIPPIIKMGDNLGVYSSIASVSNDNGELLFYSNGFEVRSRDNKVMPNGDSLLGGANTTRGTAIIPVIGVKTQYYLVTASGFFDGDSIGRTLAYSVVDMTLNNGMGDVVAAKKNMVLGKQLGESFAVVPGQNCDFWLLSHHRDSSLFKAYHITANGINTLPVVSNFPKPSGYSLYWSEYDLSTISVAHDQSKIALCNLYQSLGRTYMIYFTPPYEYHELNFSQPFNGLEIFDFSAVTGLLTNQKIIDSITTVGPEVGDSLNFYGYFGAEFSPDNSKLYVLYEKQQYLPGTYYDYLMNNTILQYDVTTNNTNTIRNSRTIVADSICFTDLRLAPDGKIYAPEHGDPYGIIVSQKISRINQPNNSGAACDFTPNIIKDTMALLGFGTTYYDYNKKITATDYPLFFCSNQDSLLLEIPPGFSDYQWHDHSELNYKKISQPGTYWVSYNDGCLYKSDTFRVRASDISKPVITVDAFQLGTTVPYYEYQWYLNNNKLEGGNNRIYTVTQNGDYFLVVYNQDGCTDTSDSYTVTNANDISETDFHMASIKLYPNPADNTIHITGDLPLNATIYSIDGRIIKELRTTQQISVSDLPEGFYLFRIYNENRNLLKVEKVIISR